MSKHGGGSRKWTGSRPSGAVPRPDELSGEDLARLAGVLREGAGISLPPKKRLLAETRLRKRVDELGLASLQEYCGKVFDSGEQDTERQHLIDALTTNKTSFFREPHHFDFLASRALQALNTRHVTAWSAGCSTGEEPWTLAMMLAEHQLRTPGFDFSILATDVSSRVLAHAARAVYSQEDAGALPEDLRKKYLLRSRDPARNEVKIVPELRQKAQFTRANLVAAEPEIAPQAEIVFCRNVMIYFDQTTQHLLLERLIAALAPGGFLFLGHSEALLSREWPLDAVAPTTYRKRAQP